MADENHGLDKKQDEEPDIDLIPSSQFKSTIRNNMKASLRSVSNSTPIPSSSQTGKSYV